MRLLHKKRCSGFSLIELLIVCVVILLIGAIAMPSMMETLSVAQARMAMGEISGLVQNCRSEAVRLNTMKSIHFAQVSGRTVLFTQNSAVTADITTTSNTDHKLYLASGFSSISAPEGCSALDGATLWGSSTVEPLNTEITFNARGLPCKYSSSTGQCLAGNGFVYYFTNTAPLGRTRLSAVSISAAGRIKAWSCNGSTWGD